MNKELNRKLDGLYQLLDELPCIKNMERIKNNIPDELIKMVEEYRILPTISKKKELYSNPMFLEYISNENELNMLIFEINQKLKNKRGQCENN